MNPPLRTKADREALVAGLADGTIDCIATDHAPHAAHEKAVEFELAPFGTTGLETALPLVITNLVAPGILGWSDVVRLMSEGPRRALGLPAMRLEPGMLADLTIINPEVEIEITADYFESRSGNSAFLGRHLTGCAESVLVGGYFAMQDGKVI
jgi:dihydroorotase